MARAPRMSRLRALALLRSAAEVLIAERVQAERQRGATWQDIGAELGVTWQAARKRYVDRT